MKVLVIDTFPNPKNRHYTVTAGVQLAHLLERSGFEVIRTTTSFKPIPKMLSTIAAIVQNGATYNLAIVPLFGTRGSFFWQEISCRLLKLLGKKIILVVHGGSIPEQVEAGSVKFMHAMNRADIVVSPSLYMKHFFEKRSVQMRCIPNSISLSGYPFHSKNMVRPNILWMRSFSDIYNPEMAVEVAAILVQKFPHLQMVMAGHDGGSRMSVMKMIQEKKLEKNITVPGYITTGQKNALAETCDIYICTNRVDNAPVTIIECMALGLLVVSVRTGGIPYIVEDGVTGILTEPGDAADMAEKIQMLINDPARIVPIQSAARKYAMTYDEDIVANSWKKLLHELNPQ